VRAMARTLMNEAIVASEVELYDHDGAGVGVVSRDRALALARARDCDLVQESAFSSPPRCRLTPRGAAERAGARAARIAEGGLPKELRVSATMGAHDVQARRRQAEGLLEKGYTVKLTARLAKAERANPVAARALLEGLARDLAAVGRLARKPFGESGALVALIEPREE